MTKDEIINKETLYNFCYEKAKNNVIKNWILKEENIEMINLYSSDIREEFYEAHCNIRIDKEIMNINKHYLGDRVLKETKKCLNKYKSCTSIFIPRLEYYITKKMKKYEQ